tara:strand:+ start:1697 stop:2068 length:372 start_codon:yes stop_codon:yes gene_type:complete
MTHSFNTMLPTGTVLSAMTSWEPYFLTNLSSRNNHSTFDDLLGVGAATEAAGLAYEAITDDQVFVEQLHDLEAGLIDDIVLPPPEPLREGEVVESINNLTDETMKISEIMDEFYTKLGGVGFN